MGRLFFGYFLLRKIAPAFSAFTTSCGLAKQKKVSRLPARELVFK